MHLTHPPWKKKTKLNIQFLTIIKTQKAPHFPCYTIFKCTCRSLVLDCCVLLEPLATGLVNFNQQVFDILDFTFYGLCLVAQLAVPPLKAMQLFFQRIKLRPFSLAIPALGK